MHLLLIFALTFTLSAQHGNNAKYMNDDDRMLERIMNAISEEGLAQLMNTLEVKKLDRLMDCIEEECKDEEFIVIIPAILEIIKGINGGKAGCSLIKTFIKDGPLNDLVKELSEEIMIKVINALNEKDIQILINMGKQGKARISDLVVLAKKLLPIIQNAEFGKGVTNLINVFKKAEQMYNSMIGKRNNRQSSNQGSSGGHRTGSNNQGGTNGANVGGITGINGAGGGPMQGNNGPAEGRRPGMNGAGGGPMPGNNGLAGGPRPTMNGTAGGGMMGMNGAGGGSMPGNNDPAGGPRPSMNGTGGGPMPGMNGAGEGSISGKQSSRR
ncbi:keratin, type II cytoskeletal 1-like isoform X3 [Crotalus tigris]|uniref:keratin, type II cytoskeletal 1-like isoform X3 n=1 Tax=Crotalus tigris TaxID=88082 RepID=UPI00192F6E17|nr:keratin, type II cytoskeletal 1-like isoform X3 [Crotalus tigris]